MKLERVFSRKWGFSSLIVLVIMGVLAVALPITTNLVQKKQENRSQAKTVASVTIRDGDRRCGAYSGYSYRICSDTDCPKGNVNCTSSDGCGTLLKAVVDVSSQTIDWQEEEFCSARGAECVSDGGNSYCNGVCTANSSTDPGWVTGNSGDTSGLLIINNAANGWSDCKPNGTESRVYCCNGSTGEIAKTSFSGKTNCANFSSWGVVCPNLGYSKGSSITVYDGGSRCSPPESSASQPCPVDKCQGKLEYECRGPSGGCSGILTSIVEGGNAFAWGGLSNCSWDEYCTNTTNSTAKCVKYCQGNSVRDEYANNGSGTQVLSDTPGGGSVCLDPSKGVVVYTCNESTGTFSSKICSSGYKCNSTRTDCVQSSEVVCSDGDQKCVGGNAYVTCNSTSGDWNTTSVSCGTGKICTKDDKSKNVCNTASTCSSSNCTACSTSNTCSTNGCEWHSTVSASGGAGYCSTATSTCSSSNCTACSTSNTCSTNGCEWHSTVSASGGAGYCSTATSTCSSSNCTACSTSNTCSTNGCEWHSTVSASGGAGYCTTCSSKSCSNGVLTTCGVTSKCASGKCNDLGTDCTIKPNPELYYYNPSTKKCTKITSYSTKKACDAAKYGACFDDEDSCNASYKDCTTANGSCILTSATCAGALQTGLCPGNSTIQCCVLCKSGQQKCSDDYKSVYTCDSNGKWGSSSPTCDSLGQVCNMPSVTTAVCAKKNCLDDPTKKKCSTTNPREVVVCNTNGVDTLTVDTCPDGQVCDPNNNANCMATQCTKGDKRCNGSESQICNDVGTGYTKVADCTNGCNSSTGLCSDCTYGKEQCQNSIYQLCQEDGSWKNSQVCTFGCDGTKCKTASTVKLQIKFALKGLTSGNDACASTWKVKIKLGKGTSQTGEYEVALTKDGTNVTKNRENVYVANIGVSGLTDLNNLAVFIKGPKHLWIKYGLSGQTDWYSQYLGQISLDASKVNVLDFSGFPVLAGDVTGDEEGIPDGYVGVEDFNYVKSRISDDSADTEELDGADVPGDTDGNCLVNAADTALVVKTLKEQHGQLY